MKPTEIVNVRKILLTNVKKKTAMFVERLSSYYYPWYAVFTLHDSDSQDFLHASAIEITDGISRRRLKFVAVPVARPYAHNSGRKRTTKTRDGWPKVCSTHVAPPTDGKMSPRARACACVNNVYAARHTNKKRNTCRAGVRLAQANSIPCTRAQQNTNTRTA